MRMPIFRLVAALAGLLWGAGLAGCDRESALSAPATPPMQSGEERSPGFTGIARSSESGRYRVVIRREDPSVPYARIHAWLVRIEAEDGALIHPTRLAFSGGMPQHGHGFQTAPQVTDALAGGGFRIDGVRFHMAGEWMLRIEFVSPAGADVALFEISIPHY